MNAFLPASAQETAKAAVARLFKKAMDAGFLLRGAHRYNEAAGDELFRVVRLKYPDWANLDEATRTRLKKQHGCGGSGKVIKPMHSAGGRYVLGQPARPVDGWPLYVPPFPLVDTGPVLYVEGESCADALAKLGITARTSVGGADRANDSDWSMSSSAPALIWSDKDKAGKKYAADVMVQLSAQGRTLEHIDVEAMDLPDKGDVVDWLQQHPKATAEEVLDLPKVPGTSLSSSTQDRPTPLPHPLPHVPVFDAAMLPASIREWCADAADGLQVPLDFTAVPAMVALAAAVGRRVGIAMKEHDHWCEVPILWGCVIGRPSSGKSPALAPAQRMLERLATEEGKVHEDDLRDHQARAMIAEATKANSKKAIQAALKKGDQHAAEVAADAAMFEDDSLSEPRLVVNDATVEKLGELLNANPRGLVLFRDELAGWLASLDRDGHEGDRAFWLECWQGKGSFTVDRIGRGTVRIEACAMSILGGMQPGKLAAYVRGAIRGGFGDDGLIQRFQLAVFPDLPATWVYTDRPLNPGAEASAWSTFKRLRNLDVDALGAECADWSDVPFIRFDSEAHELLIEWQTALMQRLRAGSESPWMESHLSKYRSLAGRLALVLHLADDHTGPVSADTLAAALNWCDYLEGHARRIYAPAFDNGLTAAHLILKRRGDLDDAFTLRQLWRKKWSGLTDLDDLKEALELLSEHHYLIESEVPTGGRPSIVYAWRVAS